MNIENSGVWLVLGAVAIAAGALWQMWLESGQQRDLLKSILESKAGLESERRDELLAAQGVRPWNLVKRRRINRLAHDESMTALTPDERRSLILSDRAGWAWSLVCTGSLAAVVGALLAL